MIDYAEPIIRAKAALQRAEHQLAMQRMDAGRNSLRDAIKAIAEAIDALSGEA